MQWPFITKFFLKKNTVQRFRDKVFLAPKAVDGFISTTNFEYKQKSIHEQLLGHCLPGSSFRCFCSSASTISAACFLTSYYCLWHQRLSSSVCKCAPCIPRPHLSHRAASSRPASARGKILDQRGNSSQSLDSPLN